MNYSEIQSKIKNAQHLDFGKILDLSINMFKEVWLKGFLMVLVLVVFAVAVSVSFSFLGFGPDPFEVDYNEGFRISTIKTGRGMEPWGIDDCKFWNVRCQLPL